MEVRSKPLRLCIACGTQRSKKEMIRIVKSKDSVISLDPTGRAAGRGAYICNDIDCIQKAEKSKALDRSFKMKVQKETYLKLAEEMKELSE